MMGYGMITWAVPLSVYPHTRDKQPLCYAALAAQKHFNTLYLMVPYADGPSHEWLAGEFKKAGKKFDMGKSCLHFKRFDDLVEDAIGKVIASQTPERFVAIYEAAHAKKRSRT
jgi:hypothetical protein